MVEIDGVVMRECAKHMRATAGDSMDNYNGDNYQIFCEDCIPRLVSTYSNAHANSKKVDFRLSVSRKYVRVWYHFKWLLKFYNLSYFDSSFLPGVENSKISGIHPTNTKYAR